MPDATELELIAQELRELDPESILDTSFHRDRAVLIAEPTRIMTVLRHVYQTGYTFLASLHGVDYYPDEPRLGVLYELLDMQRVDRITVKTRIHSEVASIDSAFDLFPETDYPGPLTWAKAVEIRTLAASAHVRARRMNCPVSVIAVLIQTLRFRYLF